MKKAYIKPEIMFENFSLSTNIAGDCEGDPVGLPTRGSCGVPGSIENMYLFDASVKGEYGCNVHSEDSENDAFCYHNPTEYNNLFNS